MIEEQSIASANQYKHGMYKVKVKDTTAAGDTFTGYFLACVNERLGIKEALEKASIASSISVSRKGASDSIPKRDEVENSELQLIMDWREI